MITKRRLNHTNLNVSDIERWVTYQEAFGLQVKFWKGRCMDIGNS